MQPLLRLLRGLVITDLTRNYPNIQISKRSDQIPVLTTLRQRSCQWELISKWNKRILGNLDAGQTIIRLTTSVEMSLRIAFRKREIMSTSRKQHLVSRHPKSLWTQKWKNHTERSWELATTSRRKWGSSRSESRAMRPIQPNTRKSGLTTILIAKDKIVGPFRQISSIKKTYRIIVSSHLQSIRSSFRKVQTLISWTQITSTSGEILGLTIVTPIMHLIRRNIKLPINSTNRKKKSQLQMDLMHPPTRLCKGRFLFRTTTIWGSFQIIWPTVKTKQLVAAILDKRVVQKIFHRAETIMTSLKRTCLWGISPDMFTTSSNIVLMKTNKNSWKNTTTTQNSANLLRPQLQCWRVTEAILKFKFKKPKIATKIKLKNKITNW